MPVEHFTMKKSWTKPELIVLVRNTADENLLTKCKHATQIISLKADKGTSNSNSSKSSCMLKIGGHGSHKICTACITPNAS